MRLLVHRNKELIRNSYEQFYIIKLDNPEKKWINSEKHTSYKAWIKKKYTTQKD